MGKRDLTFNISYRLTRKESVDLEDLVGDDKPFESLAEASRKLVLIGIRYTKIKELSKNPTFVNELEEKYHIHIAKPDIIETAKRLNPDEIDAIMLKLQNIKDDKIEQILKAQ